MWDLGDFLNLFCTTDWGFCGVFPCPRRDIAVCSLVRGGILWCVPLSAEGKCGICPSGNTRFILSGYVSDDFLTSFYPLLLYIGTKLCIIGLFFTEA